jgi:CRP-like cAMP-binding protein
MSMSRPVRPQSRNRLLARLPQDEFKRLLPWLQPVSLEFKQVLYEARSPIDFSYFPNVGVLSALALMEDGSAIEVATIGNEGVVGETAFVWSESSPNQVIVQAAGDALRIKADVLREEAGREGPLRRLLIRYHTAFLVQVSQSVACNGLHTVHQRCCRWLLKMLDRMYADVLPLTHELLAVMLGVRRASVSEVLEPLRANGLIRTRRGTITILDREGLESASCECYRTVEDEFERLLGRPR